MLYCDIINVFEGININQTSCSHECRIFHYNYFFIISFRFQPCVFHRIYYWGINKEEAVNDMKNADLNEKSKQLQ